MHPHMHKLYFCSVLFMCCQPSAPSAKGTACRQGSVRLRPRRDTDSSRPFILNAVITSRAGLAVSVVVAPFTQQSASPNLGYILHQSGKYVYIRKLCRGNCAFQAKLVTVCRSVLHTSHASPFSPRAATVTRSAYERAKRDKLWMLNERSAAAYMTQQAAYSR